MKAVPQEILKEYVKSQNFTSTGEIMEAMKEMFRDVIQTVMEVELDEKLGRERCQRAEASGDRPNYRNGHTKKTVKTQLGKVEIQVPRDRNGSFEPKIIGKYSRNVSGGTGGPDLSSATATPEDILQGKTAFTGAGKITGTYTPESGETEQKPCTIAIQNHSRIPSVWYWYNTGNSVNGGQISASDSKEVVAYPGMFVFEYKDTHNQFITVEGRNGNTFYIVIDYASPVNDKEEQYKTYFLNKVDESDLAALVEQGEPAACGCTVKCHVGAANTSCPVCSVIPAPDRARSR